MVQTAPSSGAVGGEQHGVIVSSDIPSGAWLSGVGPIAIGLGLAVAVLFLSVKFLLNRSISRSRKR